MTTAKHTPGPWHVCGGATPAYSAVHSKDGYIVFGMADATVHREADEPIQAPDMWVQRANARLIAAAPDMLTALKSAEIAAMELCTDQHPDNQCWVVLAEIRAAISRAEPPPSRR